MGRNRRDGENVERGAPSRGGPDPPGQSTPTPGGERARGGRQGPRRSGCGAWVAGDGRSPVPARRDRHARQLRERDAGRRERVPDAFFEIRVPAVQVRAQLSGAAEIGARGEDTEAAAEAGHAGGVGPVRRLPGAADDAEHVIGFQAVDREPVEPFPSGLAVADVPLPGRAFGAGRAFRCPHAHGADDPVAEPRMRLEIAAQLALDGPSLKIRGTPANRCGREHAAFLDAFEQRLAGGDGGQDQGDAVGDRVLDVLDGAGPFDLPERRVHDEKPVARDDAGQQDRHALAVLAPSATDRNQGAPVDECAAFGGHGDGQAV